MRIAVTGATGALGGQVIDLLAARAEHQIVAVSRRRPGRALPARVAVAQADYSDVATLRAAFAGVDALVFVSSDGEAVNVLHHHQNIVRAAADAGVTHVVALSGVDADIASPFCYAVTYGHTEQLLREAGFAVSIARASIFTEFFLRFLTTARERSRLGLPAADAKIAMVSRTDVGRCLAALAMSEPTGRVYDLTGPAALDMHAVTAAVTRQWNTPMSYLDVTPAQFQRELAREDLDPWWCYAFSSMFASVREHRWELVTDEVLRLTRRQPLALREVLAAHRCR